LPPLVDNARMRFASLETVRRSSAAAVRRFPLTLACAAAACAIFDVLILVRGGEHPGWFGVALALVLGIPASLAIALWNERLAPGEMGAARWILVAAWVAAFGSFAWAWPHWSGEIQARRSAQVALFAHALVAFLPYLRVREPNGFWQYNRSLLERLVVTSIFAAVLMAGLEGALAALHPLFGIQVYPKAFTLLGTWVAFVFHPWMFLAGVPALGSLEGRRDYPNTVRVFAQFILVPLVAVYQVLLTAYLLKVVVTGKWPSGLIGWLVSAEAIAGMLAILLIHPVREQVENAWVRTFARGFYVALVPSIVMLALSIAKRIGQYGVTEDRYFVVALTVWLAAISLYFIVRRDGDIRSIPITLAILALVTFGGPWGAYDVSLSSQRARLARLLREHGMWSDGRATPAPGELPIVGRRELSAVLTYLIETHGSSSLRPLLGGIAAAADSGFTDPTRQPGATRAERVAARLGFRYVNAWDAASGGGTLTWSQAWSDEHFATPVHGFDYHVAVAAPSMSIVAGSRRLQLQCDDAGGRLLLVEELGVADSIVVHTRAGTSWRAEVSVKNLSRYDTLASGSIDSLLAATDRPTLPGAPPPSVELSGPGAHAVFKPTYVFGSRRPGLRLSGLTGELFFTLSGRGDPTPADSGRGAEVGSRPP
jgi:hypothetical protein